MSSRKSRGVNGFNPVGNYNAQFTDDGDTPARSSATKQVFNLGWEMNAYSANLFYTHFVTLQGQQCIHPSAL